MDLSPGMLFSSLAIGLVGFAMIVYAKKAHRAAPFICGLVLCVAPYFAQTVVMMWLIAAATAAGTWAVTRWVG